MIFSKSILSTLICSIFLFGFAFFLRSFSLARDLVFAYDQGRDALAVQSILHGDLTLIGPTTGLTGVFLGPFYTYFLVPLYALGNGNPVVPAYMLVALHSLVAVLLYLYGKKVVNWQAGAISALLFVISFSQIQFSRWLSNPTPLPFFAFLLFLSLTIGTIKKNRLLIGLAGILCGISLQLEAANAVWFLPTTALYVLYEEFVHSRLQKRKTSEMTIRVVQSGIFFGTGVFLTLLPQLFFEIRHNFLSTRGLIAAFQTTHEVGIIENLSPRFAHLLSLYSESLFPSLPVLTIIFGIATALLFIRYRSSLTASPFFRVLLFWFLIPFVGHLIYTGNHGNFWDYYIIAQYVPLFLLIGMIWGNGIYEKSKVRVVILYFFLGMMTLAFSCNWNRWTGLLRIYTDRYAFSTQVAATEWMIRVAGDTPYGVWVYTPSAQDDAHRYVFSYVGKRTNQTYPQEHTEQQPIIFLLLEDDPSKVDIRTKWRATMEEIAQPRTVRETYRVGNMDIIKLEK